ncbi:hypothetical protein AAF712_011976 [Marasmius tenuissimus]|uniref:Major facilitator superfamily (MFS) profile domain-containing protein n=1 Tax=Marasmius tenuissimus TaxID=585030 RepID=A0ABR2ZHT7_9AGAR
MSDETSPLLGEQCQRASYNGDERREVESNVNEPQTPSMKSFLWILAPMTIGIFLSAMDQTVIVASYAAIGSEMKQLQKTSWIATSYMLTVTSFQPLYGKLSDIFGRKTCLIFAYCVFGIGCLLCGLSKTMDQLILSRALSGIGGGGMPTVVSIIMSDVVPLRSRGTWQGVLNIIFSSGSMVGAPLGGIPDRHNWLEMVRTYKHPQQPEKAQSYLRAFLIQCPAILLAIISVSVALRLPPPTNTTTNDISIKSKIKRVDFSGALTLITFIFFLLYSLERGGNVSWNDPLTLSTAVASFLAFILFIGVEMHWAKEPFAPKRIIVNSSLIASYLVNLFGVASQMAMIFHVSLYLQAVQSYSASQAGFVLVPGIIGGVTGSICGGLIIQATGNYYWVTVAGYLLQVVGTLTITLSSGVIVASVTGIAIGLTIAGLGNGGGITTSLIALISNAGKEDQAIATAVSYLFRSLGAVVGLSVGSTVLQGTLRTALRRLLTGHDIDEIVNNVRHSLKYLDTLDPDTRAIVKEGYEYAIHVTLWFSIGLSVCAVLSSLFIKEKNISRS